MTPKRPRIADNDPLNRTERVLQNFTPDDEPTGQPESPTVEVTSEQADKSEGTPSREVNTLASQKVNQPTRQPDNLITGQPDDRTASQPDNPITRQIADKSERHHDNQTTCPIDDKPARQQEEPQPIELKKATFQIDKAVLDRLEKFVLNLQLELGKENAPYKEVIVEEAIDRLIALDRTKLLKALEKRQARRKDYNK